MLTWPWDHNKGPAIIVAYPPENYSDKSWVTLCKAENTAEQQQQDKSTWITNTTNGQTISFTTVGVWWIFVCVISNVSYI